MTVDVLEGYFVDERFDKRKAELALETGSFDFEVGVVKPCLHELVATRLHYDIETGRLALALDFDVGFRIAMELNSQSADLGYRQLEIVQAVIGQVISVIDDR